jgi:hypothetical protein
MITLFNLVKDIRPQVPFHQRWMVERAIRCTLLEFSSYLADSTRETYPEAAIRRLTQRVFDRYRQRYGNPLLLWVMWTVAAAAISVIVQKVIEWWIDHHRTEELVRLANAMREHDS